MLIMIKYSSEETEKFLDQLDFSKMKGNLLPVIVQDYETKEVLMVAFSNREAIRLSLETGYAHYYSRSRDTLWKKGESSGHMQEIQAAFTDCDKDTILFKVKQEGAACHKGYYSCFFNEFGEKGFNECGEKVFDPKEVYK